MLKLCTLASGSNGNCTYITDGESHILIDAGISARTISREINTLDIDIDMLDAVFITHEHIDHISGLRTLMKYNRRAKLFSTGVTAQDITNRIPELFDRFSILESGTNNIGDIGISFFHTPHDTPESVGYRINAGGKVIVTVTDLGHVTESVMKAVSGADVLLVEANYDDEKLRLSRYPEFLKRRISGKRGHLSNTDCASCVCSAVGFGTSHVLLGHLSAENNTPEIAYTTVHTRLCDNGIIPGVDVMLGIAPRGRRGNVLVLD
jgi:phosphoribosyl 1,2-cyclic phosphodiesterase